MNVSLGALLKYYRIRKRISQLEIASLLGWSDTSRLSKIEQERVMQPSRTLVEKISEILKLDDIEKNEFLYAGRYLPTDDEVEVVKSNLKKFLSEWAGPAFLMDYTWRLLGCNSLGQKFYGIDNSKAKNVLKEKPNMLEFFFNPKYLQRVFNINWNDKKWLSIIDNELIEFKQDHHENLGEKWIQDLIRKLSQYNHFLDMWKQIHSGTTKIILNRYNLLEFDNKSKTVRFHKFIPQYARDRRFYLVLYLPVNEVGKGI